MVIFVCFLFYLSVIITQTVGQMTDEKASTTIGTQTPLPQTCLSFSSLTGNAIVSQHPQKFNSDYSPFEQKMLDNELRLQTQRNALKNIDQLLHDTQIIVKSVNDVHVSANFKSPELQSKNLQHRRMVILLKLNINFFFFDIFKCEFPVNVHRVV